MMTKNAQAAFEELKTLGASVFEWDSDEPHIAFHISGESRVGESLFVDYCSQEITEDFVAGELINPGGVRQDVHEVLRKYHLVTDWYDSSMKVVYNDPYAVGQRHDDHFSVHMLGSIGRDVFLDDRQRQKVEAMDAKQLRKRVLEQCERMRETHPHHNRFWNSLSESEKTRRLEEAIPTGNYPAKWNEMDEHLKQFRK